jgi:hypothetical protein
MESIADIKQRTSNSPYTKPLKVVVVCKKEENDMLGVALADESSCIKAYVYEKALFPKFKGTILLRNFKIGRTGNLIINKSSSVSVAPTKNLPPDIIRRATLLLNPTTPPNSPIAEAKLKKSPTTVSVTGIIIEVGVTN